MDYLLDSPFHGEEEILMMMCVLVGFAKILFGFLVKGLLAAE